MKYTIYILTFALGLSSCNNQTKERSENKNSADATQTVPNDNPKQVIYIKDKSQYDQTFIDGLSQFNKPIKLIDNFMLFGNDTIYFPDDLRLNEKATFVASQDSNRYILSLTRTNLTNINYEFKLIDKNKSIIESKSGRAILGSGFLLAPEGEPDMEAGVSFASNEYRTENDNFWLVINVGMDKDYEGKKRAKITFGYKDKLKKTEDGEQSPILRLE
jgi:hypothetical protein